MKGKAHWQILTGLVLAAGTAMVFQKFGARLPEGSDGLAFINGTVEVCRFTGKIFMRALQMLIVPLIVTSVIAGIASLHGMEGFGRLGGKTVGFYALTSFMAILVGLVVVNVVKPGLENGKPNEVIRMAIDEQAASATDAEKAKVEAAGGRKSADVWDIFKRMFPPNIFKAATDNGQMLGLIVFSIMFALAMTRLPIAEISTLRDVFQSLNDVMIVMTKWVMATAPIGVFALILPIVYGTGGELFVKLGLYFVTVLGALGIHFFITLPLILSLLGKVSPLAHYKAMRTALLTAFSTSSSSATLPVTMRCVQDNAGVSKKTASFTLPLGATVNMDGTALYECVAVIFVSQVVGFEMGLGAQFMVVLAALLTSIGVAGIPSASLVAILLIMKSSGIPHATEAAFLLLAIDRPLDMCRTAVNVFGDSCAAVVIGKSEGEEGILEGATDQKVDD